MRLPCNQSGLSHFYRCSGESHIRYIIHEIESNLQILWEAIQSKTKLEQRSVIELQHKGNGCILCMLGHQDLCHHQFVCWSTRVNGLYNQYSVHKKIYQHVSAVHLHCPSTIKCHDETMENVDHSPLRAIFQWRQTLLMIFIIIHVSLVHWRNWHLKIHFSELAQNSRYTRQKWSLPPMCFGLRTTCT